MKPLLAGLILAKALDVHSTCLGLRAGAEELNPLLPGSCGGQVVTQSVLTVGAVFGLAQLFKTRPKLAKGLAIVVIVAGGVAAVHNYSVQAQQLQQR